MFASDNPWNYLSQGVPTKNMCPRRPHQPNLLKGKEIGWAHPVLVALFHTSPKTQLRNYQALYLQALSKWTPHSPRRKFKFVCATVSASS